jgi:hypothetical protein
MVVLVWNGRRTKVSLPIPSHTEDLIREAERISGISPTRIRITFQVGTDSRQLSPTESIPSEPTEFLIIDSGPQISPTVSNLFEYGFPIILWLLVLFLNRPELNEYVQLTTLMWILHFTKRIFEVLFVHTFSKPIVFINERQFTIQQLCLSLDFCSSNGIKYGFGF